MPAKNERRPYRIRKTSAEPVTAAGRKHKLRLLQQEAEECLTRLGEEWMESLVNANQKESSRLGSCQVFPSAHECNEAFPHNIPRQYPFPILPGYPYEEREMACPTPPTPASRKPRPSSARLFKEDLRQIAHSTRSFSCCSTQGSFANTESTEIAPVVKRFNPFVSSLGVFDLEQQDPALREKNRKLKQEDIEWERKKQAAKFAERRLKHLCWREDLISRHKAKMKARFQKALLRREPHAIEKLNEVLLELVDMQAAKQEGSRCAPSSATKDITEGVQLYALGDTIKEGVIELLRKGNTEASSEEVPRRKSRVTGALLSPAPPLEMKRRNSSGQLLEADQLVRPRPAKFVSERSEQMVVAARKHLIPLGSELSPPWEMTAAETISELDAFDLRRN